MSKLRRILAVTALLLAPSALPVLAQNPTTIPDKPQALAFLHRLQNALRIQDKKQLAALIQYPLQALENGNPHMIQNQSQLLREYDLIFTPAKIKAILQCKDSDIYYHADEGGYMIPYAVIWFDDVPVSNAPHARKAFTLTTVNDVPAETK